MPLPRSLPAVGVVLLLGGCGGQQSWLEGAGNEARAIETLTWILFVGAGVIWTLVMGLAVYATRISPGAHSERRARQMVVWGGVVLPTAVIGVLLVSGLFMLRAIVESEPVMTVRVDGEQWWWRIVYENADGEAVTTANEVRLPVGRTAEILLTADDVIHSFWIPALGGKMDMIPGRQNRLTLTPVKTGAWRGVCAEYCGGAHAQMAFPVIIMEDAAFDDWLAAQARPAADDGAAGREAFLAAGCGACHTVRGTPANGEVGPDLTHVGSRTMLGAGILPMTEDAMFRFIARTEEVKPGVLMPEFGALPDREIRAIAAWLLSLK